VDILHLLFGNSLAFGNRSNPKPLIHPFIPWSR